MKSFLTTLAIGLIASLSGVSVAQALDQREPSNQPPGNLKAEQVPQFVVIGFDDNTLPSGMNWASRLFYNRVNPTGTGSKLTYDGTPARTSFYMNTLGLTEWQRANPAKMQSSVKRLLSEGHEIANHTHNHHADLLMGDLTGVDGLMANLSSDDWSYRVQQCTDTLASTLNRPASLVKGFRAPFLKYNQALFDTLQQQGISYDSSIEEGSLASFHAGNMRWPYTLHNGSPGHDESWAGSIYNPNQVVLTGTAGLWELPIPMLIIPKNREGLAYGIPKGLWMRMKARQPYLQDRRISGFDYNLWTAGLTKAEFVGVLKYNLDQRIAGNRAPFIFGAHSQYYTDPAWSAVNAPQVNRREMQAALTEFIDYALSLPMVRMRPAQDVLAWCRDPSPL